VRKDGNLVVGQALENHRLVLIAGNFLFGLNGRGE